MRRILRAATTSVWVILLIAFVLRLGFMRHYVNIHSRQAVSVIPFLFESGNIAHSLATDHGFASPFRVDTGPTAWMTPVYPMLLAGIFRLFGTYTFKAWSAAVLLNIVFCTFACVPIFYAGKRVGGIGLAALAAWLWAIFPNAILLPVESMWDASISALLVATILLATMAIAESQRWRDWCAYGSLWGIALMTNPTLAAPAPFLLGWMVWRRQKRSLPWRNQAAACVVIMILCCVPWTERNYVVFRRFVPLRSVLGLQLWLGNNDRTRDIFRGELHPIYNTAERDEYVAVGELDYMQGKRQQALHYMLTHPSREIQLIGRRFISIWSGGTPYPLVDFIRTPWLWFRYILAFNVFASMGALCGIFILFRAGNEFAFPVAAFPIVYPWAYYLTLALPRYRLPIDPVVLLLSGVTLRWMVRGLGRRVLDLSQQRA